MARLFKEYARFFTIKKLQSIATFRARIITLSGKVKDSEEHLSVIYVGSGANYDFVRDRFFNSNSVARNHGSCNIWKAAQVVATHTGSTDLSVIDLPWPYEVNYDDDRRVLELPAWVHQELELRSDWSTTVANFHRNVRGAQMRKIRKHQLGCRTTKDRAAIKHFYDDMYVPHSKRRFGAAAKIEKRRAIQSGVSAGTLIQIIRDESVIASSVLRRSADTLRMSFVGFSDANLRNIDGASAALYYFTLEFAFKEGCRTVDFCGSRPFLDDGVLQTKRSWGATVYDDWALETLLIQFNNSGSAVRAFLASHPVIVRQNEKLVGKVYVDNNSLSVESARNLAHRMTSPGLDQLLLYCQHGYDAECENELASSAIPIRIVDLSNRADPVAAFCGDTVM